MFLESGRLVLGDSYQLKFKKNFNKTLQQQLKVIVTLSKLNIRCK